jgi:hypothetical protein
MRLSARYARERSRLLLSRLAVGRLGLQEIIAGGFVQCLDGKLGFMRLSNDWILQFAQCHCANLGFVWIGGAWTLRL